jgi:hypothetical protein
MKKGRDERRGERKDTDGHADKEGRRLVNEGGKG